MDNKTAYWSLTIINSVCVICFTALAIIFNKWWIVLFAPLCMTTFKTQPTKAYYRTCDKCGIHSEYASSNNEAIKKARDAGWIIRKVGDKWDDRCPDCQMKNEGF